MKLVRLKRVGLKRVAGLLRHRTRDIGLTSLRSRLINYLLIKLQKNRKISKYKILVLVEKARYEVGESVSEGVLAQANGSSR